jgi:hypothetical protein
MIASSPDILNLSQRIHYFRPRNGLQISEAMSLGYQRFNYNWLHRPTNKTGTEYVYCHTLADFHALLAEWNTEDWSYFAV